MRTRWGIVLACVAAVGCGVEGTPQPTADMWDPCSLDPSALVAAGVDPQPIATDYLGGPKDDFRVCTWRGVTHYVSVESTTHEFEEFEQNPTYVRRTDVQVGGRHAISYQSDQDALNISCRVAFVTETAGVLIVGADITNDPSVSGRACEFALAAAQSLRSSLPD